MFCVGEIERSQDMYYLEDDIWNEILTHMYKRVVLLKLAYEVVVPKLTVRLRVIEKW